MPASNFPSVFYSCQDIVGNVIKKLEQNPKLSIATSFCYEVPLEEQMKLIASAGFTHFTLSVRPEHSGYLNSIGRNRLMDLCSRFNLSIDTIHGRTFTNQNSAVEASDTIRAAKALNVRRIVFHPGAFNFAPKQLQDRFRLALSISQEIEPVLRDMDMAAAFENVMPGPATELTRLLLPELDPKYFGFCYDSSHDQIEGPRPYTLLEQLRNRVSAIHLSDRKAEFIDHLVPGEGFVDFPLIMTHLRESAYSDPILLEVMMQHSEFKDVSVFLSKTHEAGCKLWHLLKS